LSKNFKEKPVQDYQEFFSETERITDRKTALGLVILGFDRDFARLLKTLENDFSELQLVKVKISPERLWVYSTDEVQRIKEGKRSQ